MRASPVLFILRCAIPAVLLTATNANAAGARCEWAPDLSGGPLDVTFYVTSDSEIGRGRPMAEYVRYQRELVDFARSRTRWPEGFRGAGAVIAPPTGIATTGDNIFGGPGGENPFTWLIQRLRFEWLWSRSRVVPPFDVFVDPTILQIEAIPYPVYPGLGNHDWDAGSLQGGEATLLDHIRRVIPGCSGVTNFHAPSGNYSWNWGRLHLIQLNEWAGARGRGGLEWLRADLGRVGADAPVVLLQHYGFDGFSREARWWADADRSAFLDVVCDYNVLGVVSGHTHHAFPADRTPVACPAGRRLARVRNFIGEDGILFNSDGYNQYFGDAPQGTGTFMVFRVVDDGTPVGSFMDVATVSWRRDAPAGVEIRNARNGLDFTQTFSIATEAPDSFRNLDLGAWRRFAGPLRGPAVPVRRADGWTELFAVSPTFGVQVRHEVTPGGLSDWQTIDGGYAKAVAATLMADGRVLLLTLTPAGAIAAVFQDANGRFSPPQRVGTPADVFTGVPRLVTVRDGGVEVHAVRSGVIYRTRITSLSGGEPWQVLGGPLSGTGVVGSPALVRTGDGRLAVVARDAAGLVYVNRQFAEDGGWSGWVGINARAVDGDVSAIAVDATIEIFAREAQGARTWTAAVDIDGLTSVEATLDGPRTLGWAPTAGIDDNGELRLVVVDREANLHWNRRRPGETWTGWNAVPRQAVGARPELLPGTDGRVDIYAPAPLGTNLLRASELASWGPVPR